MTSWSLWTSVPQVPGVLSQVHCATVGRAPSVSPFTLHPDVPARKPSMNDAILSILAYSVASNGMIIANKLILSSFQFPMNLLLLAIQVSLIAFI